MFEILNIHNLIGYNLQFCIKSYSVIYLTAFILYSDIGLIKEMVKPQYSIDETDAEPPGVNRQRGATVATSVRTDGASVDSGISSGIASMRIDGSDVPYMSQSVNLDSRVHPDGSALGSYRINEKFQGNPRILSKEAPSSLSDELKSSVSSSISLSDSKKWMSQNQLQGSKVHSIHSIHPKPEKQIISLHEASVMKLETLVVAQDKEGDNEIILAAIKNHEDYVILLIDCLVYRKCPKYLNITNDLGQSILYLTVYRDMARATKRLVEIEEVELDVRDHKGNTPLHLACEKGYLQQVKILTLQKKPKSNVLSNNSSSDSISNRSSELTETESERARRDQNKKPSQRELAELKNYNGWNCLHVAVQNGHIDVVNYLIKDLKMDANCPGGSRGMTPCHIAVENDDIPMLIYLIHKAKVDVNILTYDKWSPVQFAAFKQEESIIKLLIACRAHKGDVEHCQTLMTSQAQSINDEYNGEDEDEEYDSDDDDWS